MAGTEHDRRRRVMPDRAQAVIVWLVFYLVVAILLSILILASKPARAGLVEVPGTFLVSIINPPQPVGCDFRGWDFLYTPSGIAYRAHSAQVDPVALVIDITPVIDQCVFVDGFELEA